MAGTVASYCISYTELLVSESDAIRVGNSLSQGLFEFWRERHTQVAARGPAHGKLSFTDPAIDCIRCNSEAGGNLFHAQLARSEGL